MRGRGREEGESNKRRVRVGKRIKRRGEKKER